MRDASRALVKFDITDISQPLTVTDIDYFFFFKSKIRMRSPAEIPFFYSYAQERAMVLSKADLLADMTKTGLGYQNSGTTAPS